MTLTGSLVGLATSLLLFAAALLFLRHAQLRAEWADAVEFRLQFPRDLSPEAVTVFFGGLSGLLPPLLKRLWSTPTVCLETEATTTGTTHRLIVPRAYRRLIEGQLRAALPNVRFTVEPLAARLTLSLAGEFRLSTASRPLRSIRAPEIAASILSSLQPLKADERLVVQWIITPGGPVPQPRRSASNQAMPLGNNTLVLQQSEDVQDRRAKFAEPVFLAAGRIGVDSEPARARLLLRQLSGAFHLANAPGVHLRRRWLPSWLAASAIRSRRAPLIEWPCLLNAAELSGLCAWPFEGVQLPGLVIGGCRQLAPSSAIPRAGAVIGVSTYGGEDRPIALSSHDRVRHTHIVGPTGSGKSTLLLNLITQDMSFGRGVIVVDPKGDLVTNCLERVPGRRRADVIVFDPADEARPLGLNLLANANDSQELVVDHIVGLFHNLYRAFWGPRTDDILRAALLTLIRRPGMTLAEVPLLLTDEGFRQQLIGDLDEPIALEPFWGWFTSLSEAERSAAVGPVLNKLRTFLLRSRIRNIIGQPESSFSVETVLSERRILLVSLAKGLLGQEAAALLGSLFVSQLWQATMHRAAAPEAERPPVMAFLDEWQDFLNIPLDLSDLLAQARGFGLALHLAHQHLQQLPTDLRRAVLANARSKVCFQQSADDARLFAREFAPHLSAEDLQGLGPYEIVAALSVNGQVLTPVTAVTQLPPPASTDVQAIRQVSRERYGRPRAEVERALRARHGHPVAHVAGAVGRRQRRSKP